MLLEIIHLLLNIVVSIVAGSCLLRAFMHFLSIRTSPGSGNPFAALIFPVTDWLVLPLRKLLPHWGKIDLASILGALFAIIFKNIIIDLLRGFLSFNISVLLINCIFDVFSIFLSAITGLVFINILLSWVQNNSPTQYYISLLVEPLLSPIRNKLPSSSGLDFSPIILLVLIQVLEIVLSHLRNLFIAIVF